MTRAEVRKKIDELWDEQEALYPDLQWFMKMAMLFFVLHMVCLLIGLWTMNLNLVLIAILPLICHFIMVYHYKKIRAKWLHILNDHSAYCIALQVSYEIERGIKAATPNTQKNSPNSTEGEQGGKVQKQ